jgi:hypothetical protein
VFRVHLRVLAGMDARHYVEPVQADRYLAKLFDVDALLTVVTDLTQSGHKSHSYFSCVTQSAAFRWPTHQSRPEKDSGPIMGFIETGY